VAYFAKLTELLSWNEVLAARCSMLTTNTSQEMVHRRERCMVVMNRDFALALLGEFGKNKL